MTTLTRPYPWLLFAAIFVLAWYISIGKQRDFSNPRPNKTLTQQNELTGLPEPAISSKRKDPITNNKSVIPAGIMQRIEKESKENSNTSREQKPTENNN